MQEKYKYYYRDYSFEIKENFDDDVVIVLLTGRVDVSNYDRFKSRAEDFWKQFNPRSITLDLSNLKYIDSSAAMIMKKFEKGADDASIPFQYINLNDSTRKVSQLIDLKRISSSLTSEKKESSDTLERIGKGFQDLFYNSVSVLTFLGEVVQNLVYSLLHPKTIRLDNMFFYMKRVGVDGLPIVGMICFLVGMVMAFMSSLQLKQFGANIYVASLVSFAIIRELGPIMTAIIVAGRSGSAFAAEIGSMIINEEVSALQVMGLESIRFLVIPKLLAAILVVPILTIYANAAGVLGGLLVGVMGLDLTAYTYMEQSMNSFEVFDVVACLIKAVVFAVLITVISCHRGFQVRGGAESVGALTTSAVVASIFLIILADSAFAVLLYYIR